jgi:hypothetical protein
MRIRTVLLVIGLTAFGLALPNSSQAQQVVDPDAFVDLIQGKTDGFRRILDRY